MPRWSVISFWSPLDLKGKPRQGFRNLGQWLAGPHTRQIKPAPAAIARGFTYDEFRNRGGPGSILRPTTRPTSVRDCRPQPALATDITELPNIPTKPGAYALVHSVLLYRSPDQPRQTATVMFSDPSHHHAGSTVWYRGRGGDGQFIGAFSSPRLSHVRSRSIPVLPGGHRGEVHRIPHAALVLFVQVAIAHLPFLPFVSYVLTLHSYFKIPCIAFYVGIPFTVTSKQTNRQTNKQTNVLKRVVKTSRLAILVLY